jgi:hypothetical protein
MNSLNDFYYQFYFKLAYTCETKIYSINPNITIKNFINYIKHNARYDFHIEDNEDIEIVEAGQPNNINGRDAEQAPAIIASDETVRQKYGARYTTIAFYIRKIPAEIRLTIPEQYVEINEYNNSSTVNEIIGNENV